MRAVSSSRRYVCPMLTASLGRDKSRVIFRVRVALSRFARNIKTRLLFLSVTSCVGWPRPSACEVGA